MFDTQQKRIAALEARLARIQAHVDRQKEVGSLWLDSLSNTREDIIYHGFQEELRALHRTIEEEK